MNGGYGTQFDVALSLLPVMPLRSDVIDRLLLSRSLVDRYRLEPALDRYAVSAHVLSAHDAAELAAAAICSHLQVGQAQGPRTPALMDYVAEMKKHSGQPVPGREYMSQLNRVRTGLKHEGVLPELQQWARVAEGTFDIMERWCSEYLGTPLSAIDRVLLLNNNEVRRLYADAQKYMKSSQFREALKTLALAMDRTFRQSRSWVDIEAGLPRTEDAIFVMSFGVPGAPFLALQETLPHVARYGPFAGTPKWKQAKYGHPGNWDEGRVRYCSRTFLDVAIKLQDASGVFRPISRDRLYEFEIEALRDDTPIWKEAPAKIAGDQTTLSVLAGFGLPSELVLSRTLAKGEKLRATSVSLDNRNVLARLPDGGPGQAIGFRTREMEAGSEFVRRSDVSVRCVPRQDDFVQTYFPNLESIDWEPE